MNREEFEKSIQETEKISRRVRNTGWIFVALGFIGLIIGFFYWCCFGGELNEVGDFVGGVSGSLWALAGLFFIYLAFLGQKIEIKNQQQELKESREVFKEQADIMLEQQFDNTFFNLLDNHRKLVNSFKSDKKVNPTISLEFGTTYDIEVISGYEALESIYGSLKWYLKEYSKFLKSRNVFIQNITRSNPISQIKGYRNIEILYNEVSGIVEFISSKIKEENKEFYFKTLFNNLSIQENFLLTAYNINCSENYLKELDFENYLKYNLVNFSDETSFISEPKVLIEKKYSDSEKKYLDFKITFNSSEEYEELNLYLINEEEELITEVESITEINQEHIIDDLIIKITKKFFPEEFSQVVNSEEADFEYVLLSQAYNYKYNFSMFYMFTIRVRLEQGDIKAFNHHYGQKINTWIQDHFNNIENQQS